MAGIFYGVGVGPGDPEYMTLKAIRMIQENEIIACPGADPRETVAYKIAVQAVPELAEKTLIPLYMPMTHNTEEIKRNHIKAADMVESYLKEGKNIVFLTLGDPTVYSTYTYVQLLIEERGYQTGIVSGITSFCAAAAASNTPLTLWSEPLHIIPASHGLDMKLDQPGNYIFMKSGKKMNQVKEVLRQYDKDVVMVENCGMPEEHIYRSVDEIPDTAGYYSLIIAKER